MLSTFVKVGKVSSLSDARYCAGMMVDQLGFNLNQHDEDYVSPQKFQEITQWVSGPEFVGEAIGLSWGEVCEAIESYGLTHIETDEVDFIAPLTAQGLHVAYRTHVKENEEISLLEQLVSREQNLMLILEAGTQGLIEEVEKSSVAAMSLIQIQDETLADQITKSGSFKGVELTATPEEKPGFKDYGNLMDILEKLEN